jgi:hypothetical protein
MYITTRGKAHFETSVNFIQITSEHIFRVFRDIDAVKA